VKLSRLRLPQPRTGGRRNHLDVKRACADEHPGLSVKTGFHPTSNMPTGLSSAIAPESRPSLPVCYGKDDNTEFIRAKDDVDLNFHFHDLLWRRLVLPKRIDKWSLTSLQQRLVKTGGRLVKHARLLAASGGEPSNTAAVWEHGAAYCGLAGATWVALVLADENPTNRIGRRSARVSTETAEKRGRFDVVCSSKRRA
jgi:hypothetical protein